MTNILNPHAVEEFCLWLASRSRRAGVKEWILHNVRNHLTRTIDAHLVVLNRAPAGAPEWAKRSAPPFHLFRRTAQLDRRFEHVVDWADATYDDATVRHLRHMPFPVAVERAQLWLLELSRRRSHQSGKVEEVMRFPDGYRVVRLCDRAAFYHEGRSMNHCVGGLYGERESLSIYSLRDQTDEPHITMEVHRIEGVVQKGDWTHSLHQCKGKGNRLDSVKYLEYIAAFFDKFNIFTGGCPDVRGLFIKRRPRRRSITLLDTKPIFVSKSGFNVRLVHHFRVFMHKKTVLCYVGHFGRFEQWHGDSLVGRDLFRLLHQHRDDILDYLNNCEVPNSYDFERSMATLGLVRQRDQWNYAERAYPPVEVYDDGEYRVVRTTKVAPRRDLYVVYRGGERVASAYVAGGTKVFNMTKHPDVKVLTAVADILTNRFGFVISLHLRRQYMLVMLNGRNVHLDTIHPHMLEYILGIIPIGNNQYLLRHKMLGFRRYYPSRPPGRAETIYLKQLERLYWPIRESISADSYHFYGDDEHVGRIVGRDRFSRVVERSEWHSVIDLDSR